MSFSKTGAFMSDTADILDLQAILLGDEETYAGTVGMLQEYV
jgi:hypothetical protein